MSKPNNNVRTIVYIATNIINGKRYVGITCGYLSRRKGSHHSSARSGSKSYFHRAIRKYGMASFQFDVASIFKTYEEGKNEEIRLIAETHPEYNLTKGGDGASGYKHSPENVRRMSERQKGKPGYWKGKKIPAHVVELAKQRCLSMPEEDRRRILALGPKSIQCKVVCLNDGEHYESIKMAAMAYGVSRSSISTVCKRSKIRKSVGGLVFRYLGDHHGGVEEAIATIRAAKMSQCKRLSPRYKKSVIRLNDRAVFQTVKEAAAASGLARSTVIRSCRGRHLRGSFSGLKFKYVSNCEQENMNAPTP